MNPSVQIRGRADLRHALERFRQQQERLQLLFNVTRNITRELVLDRLLLRIMDEVKRVLDCDRCSVFILDEEHNELWARVAHGEAEIRFPKNVGIAGYVATTGEILNIVDAYDDPRFNPEIDRRTGYMTRNLLATPLRNRAGEVIGVFQALNKAGGPFTRDDEELLDAIGSISAAQIENAMLYEEQKRTFDSFMKALAGTIDARDPMTAGHSYRTALYADEIALLEGFEEEEREVLRTAALLHDYGKIAVREAVLTKKTPLTDEEYEHLRSHPRFTRSILEKINFSRHLRDVPRIASAHHEKWDGSGYPEGLKGEEIPAAARILAVCDVFDALTSVRHYRDRQDIRQVMRVMKEGIGKEFDGRYVRALYRIPLNRLVEILEFDHLPLPNAEKRTLLAGRTLEELIDEGRPVRQDLFEVFDFYYSRRYLAES